ncbi:hypothetical protein [Rhodococcus sp. B10]|uniref:hypothetical protein n=1 Tax=Rhodococcus sp. B10 TaxID=2695876 RepID=UPI001430F809|nr:hypothetical protein [Rhodococcus sp. B10]NIL78413.1 hypothetical protein [Rhodococcus sp. B10]
MTTPATLTTDRRRRIRRTLTVLAMTAAMVLITPGIASAQIANPFEGITPDIGIFGPALNTTWKRWLAGAWGACMAIASYFVLTSFLKLRKARNRGMSTDLSDASDDLRFALLSLAGIASISPIIGGLIYFVQPAA